MTDASDQVTRIYIGQEELKVRRMGHNATLEQDAVHISCEADLAAHVLDVQGRQLSVKGLLDTGAVVSVMPVSTWTDMGFDRSDLIPTNIRLAAANQGAIYVSGRTPIISLQLGGRHHWMSFLVVVQNVQQELATKEVEQWVRSELESTVLREKFDFLGKTTKEEDK